jgi:hypothetical protein
MSGYSGDALGFDADYLPKTKSRFVQKPFSPRQLIQAVRQCLDEKLTLAAKGP